MVPLSIAGVKFSSSKRGIRVIRGQVNGVKVTKK